MFEVRLVSAAFVILVTACGGDDDHYGGRYGNPAGSDDDAGGSGDDAGAAQPSGESDAGGKDSAAGGDGSNNDASGPDASGKIDGGVKDPGVACGNGDCLVPSQACCAPQGGGAGAPACQPSNQGCPGDDAYVMCDDTADCINGLCCGVLYNGKYGAVSCQTQCAPNEIQFCDPNVNDCPPQTTCKPSQLLLGYHVCH